jgi:hypothetical protein
MRNKTYPLAILHIGTEKTGNGSIQNYLGANRELLARKGILIPKAGAPNGSLASHFMLTAYAADPKHIKHNRDVIADDADFQRIRKDFVNDLSAELRDRAGMIGTVVFSSELLHSRLMRKDEIAELKALLDRYFKRYMIVVYFRRQDELAVSAYNEYIKDGFSGSNIFGNTDDAFQYTKHYYDYIGLINLWSSVFGREALVPRIYDRNEFPSGDVVLDFLNTIRVGQLVGATRPVDRNPSLSIKGQDLLRAFNRHYKLVRGYPKALAFRNLLITYLEENFTGRGRRPSRKEARAFLATFAAGNQQLLTEWFPGRSSLFSESFEQYPEIPDQETATAELLAAMFGFTIFSVVRALKRRAKRALSMRRWLIRELQLESGEVDPSASDRSRPSQDGISPQAHLGHHAGKVGHDAGKE